MCLRIKQVFQARKKGGEILTRSTLSFTKVKPFLGLPRASDSMLTILLTQEHSSTIISPSWSVADKNCNYEYLCCKCALYSKCVFFLLFSPFISCYSVICCLVFIPLVSIK